MCVWADGKLSALLHWLIVLCCFSSFRGGSCNCWLLHTLQLMLHFVMPGYSTMCISPPVRRSGSQLLLLFWALNVASYFAGRNLKMGVDMLPKGTVTNSCVGSEKYIIIIHMSSFVPKWQSHLLSIQGSFPSCPLLSAVWSLYWWLTRLPPFIH